MTSESYSHLLTGCQLLLWNKPIKSSWNQSPQLYTKTGLEISIDFGPEKMSQNVAYLGEDVSVIQMASCDKLLHSVFQYFHRRHSCFVGQHMCFVALPGPYLLFINQVCFSYRNILRPRSWSTDLAYESVRKDRGLNI